MPERRSSSLAGGSTKLFWSRFKSPFNSGRYACHNAVFCGKGKIIQPVFLPMLYPKGPHIVQESASHSIHPLLATVFHLLCGSCISFAGIPQVLYLPASLNAR